MAGEPNKFNITYATANCNNQGLGTFACPQLVAKLIVAKLNAQKAKEQQKDALIINCQEANFTLIKQEIEAELKKQNIQNYKISEINRMVTYTQNTSPFWKTPFRQYLGEVFQVIRSRLSWHTGIATFIIHRNDIQISNIKRQEVRRKYTFLRGSEFNKGGLLSRFTLSSSNTKSTVIDTISGHYESSGIINRAKDHQNVYLGYHQMINSNPFNSFDDLSQAMPNQFFYGADTNVRDRFIEGNNNPNSSENLWLEKGTPEMQSLCRLPLAPTQHSAENTYGQLNRKSEKEKEKRKDLMLAPLAKKGRLDINSHFGSLNTKDGQTNPIIDADKINLIDVTDDTPGPDHVIVTTDLELDCQVDDFKKVKLFLCGRLQNFRPRLADSLEKLADDNENRAYLLEIYNLYYSIPNGLIHIMMQKHQRYLNELKLAINNAQSKEEILDIKNTHEKVTKSLWAEPKNKRYKKLINYSRKSNKGRKKLLNYFLCNKNNIENISKNALSGVKKEQLKKTIGNYNKKLTIKEREEESELKKLINESLNENSKKELYKGLSYYQENHLEKVNEYLKSSNKTVIKTDDSHFFRKKLMDYLTEHPLPYIDNKKKETRETNPNNAAIEMKDFIGKEGIELYQLALEEEAQSKEYRDAVYLSSASLVDGPQWTQRPINFIAGASGCGKTYIAKIILKKVRQLLNYENDSNKKNLMIQPDGGIVREVSQIRKLMVQVSTAHGYPGISDLQKKSNPLESIKHNVLNAAFASDMKVGVNIPDTFAPWSFKKILANKWIRGGWIEKTFPKLFGEYNDIRTMKDIIRRASALDGGTAKLFFTRIRGPVQESTKEIAPLFGFWQETKASFKEVVEFMGTKRAFKKKGFELPVNFDLNNEDIVESKKYGSEGFKHGENGSTAAEEWVKEKVKNITIIHAENDLKIVRTNTKDKTYEHVRKDVKGAFLISQQVLDAWDDPTQTNPPIKQNNNLSTYKLSELAHYYKKNKKPVTLEGFNSFLGKNGTIPEPKITGTKDITLKIVKEKIEVLNQEENKINEIKKIKKFIINLPVNYTFSQLYELNDLIKEFKCSNDIKKKLDTLYKELQHAYEISNISTQYDALHMYLNNKKKSELEYDIVNKIENSEPDSISEEDLVSIINKDINIFFNLSLQQQLLIYQGRGITETIKKHINTEALNKERENINIELLKVIVMTKPELFFQIPYEYQKPVHLSLLQALTIGKDKQKATASIKKIQEISHKELCDILEIKTKQLTHDVREAFKPINKEDENQKATQDRLINNIVSNLSKHELKEYMQDEALLLIDKYLKSSYNSSHKKIFIELKEKIQENGFSHKNLNDYIIKQNQTIKSSSYYSIFNLSHYSPAYILIKDLYELLPGAKKISKESKEQLLKDGTLPKISNESRQRKEDIAKQLRLVLNEEKTSKKNNFTTEKLKRITKYLNVINRNDASSIINSEAIYQQYLIEKSLKTAINDIPDKTNRYSIQGHILLSVTLEESDYHEIYKRINHNQAFTPNEHFQKVKDALAAVLGEVTETTQCSLDIIGHTLLKNEFCQWLQSTPPSDIDTKALKKSIDVLTQSESRSSIISLQEEMEAHFHLFSKVSRELITQDLCNNANWKKIKDNTLQALSRHIKNIIQKKLSENYLPKTDEINYQGLNKSLDAERKALSYQVKLEFFKAIKEVLETDYNSVIKLIENDLVNEEKNIVKKLTDIVKKHKVKSVFSKGNFSHKTATGNDTLRTDTRNQTVVRVTATKLTAHDKQLKNHAKRLIKRNHFNFVSGVAKVRPIKYQNIEQREPSLAVLKDAKGNFYKKNKIIEDVREKLEDNYKTLSKSLGDYQGVMFCNLLTSIDPAVDTATGLFKVIKGEIKFGENYQALSAELIIKGTHEFNKSQLKKGFENSFFYTQNIPVNQHGRSLSINAFSTQPVKEACLMSELSMLANLNLHQRYLPPETRNKMNLCYRQVQHAYIEFLNSNYKTSQTFSDSNEGQVAIKALNEYKNSKLNLKKDLLAEDKTLQHLCAESLAIMHANNIHQDLAFGMTIQALSVFLEPASIAGCKSANERYACISGRVELLHSIDNRDGENSLSQQELLIISQMRMLIEISKTNDMKKIISSCTKLQKALDIAYNKHNLQGSAQTISEEDQGITPKVQKSSNIGSIRISEFNTNFAESSYVSWLFQGSAGNLQAHKLKHKKSILKAIKEIENDTSQISGPTEIITPLSVTDTLWQDIALLALGYSDKHNLIEIKKAKSKFCTFLSISEKDFSWQLIYALLNDQKHELSIKLILNVINDGIEFTKEEKVSSYFKSFLSHKTQLQEQVIEIKKTLSIESAKDHLSPLALTAIHALNNSKRNTNLSRTTSARLSQKYKVPLTRGSSSPSILFPQKDKTATSRQPVFKHSHEPTLFFKKKGVFATTAKIKETKQKKPSNVKIGRRKRHPKKEVTHHLKSGLLKKEKRIRKYKRNVFAYQAEEEQRETIAVMDRLFGKDSRKLSDDVNIQTSFDMSKASKIYSHLKPCDTLSDICLKPSLAQQYKEDLDKLLFWLENMNEKIERHKKELQALALHKIYSSNNKAISHIDKNLAILEENRISYSALKDKVYSSSKKYEQQANVASISLDEITTTYINPDLLESSINSYSLSYSGSINGNPLKTLEKIPENKIALHQTSYINKEKEEEPLAFTESGNHNELKTTQFKENTSDPAKMKLAFVMAQKFIMNLDGLPSPDNKIYLRGNDPQFVEMLYGALYILSKTLNYPTESISVLAQGVNIKKHDDSFGACPCIVMEIKEALDENYLNQLLTLSQEVQKSKKDEELHAQDKLDNFKKDLVTFTQKTSFRGGG